MRLSIAALGLVLTACYSSGEGISPPLDRIYFPVGLTTDCDARAGADATCQAKRLYVASSDFDLQFNAGSIQVIDLDRVRGLIPTECQSDDDCAEVRTNRNNQVCDTPDKGWQSSYFCVDADNRQPCGAIGTQTAAERILVPGPCRAVDLVNPAMGSKLLIDNVATGAFASDIVLTSLPEAFRVGPQAGGPTKRLLVPLRGEASLNWIDIKPEGSVDAEGDAYGKLDCGQTGTPRTCNRAHRVGTQTTENTRGLRMPTEPYAIATSDEGDAIVVTHQTEGKLSLFYQNLTKWSAGPNLEYVHALPASVAVAIAAAPEPQTVRKQRVDWLQSVQACKDGTSVTPCQPDPFPPGFLVAYANAAQLDLVRFHGDLSASPSRAFLQAATTVSIRANSQDIVSRGVTYDDTERRKCDSNACATDPLSADCVACANISIGTYVSSRSPASLLVGGTMPGTIGSPARDVPQFQNPIVPLPIGPSRVYVGKVVVDDGTAKGTLETRIFVVCFDQRRIAIYDPRTRRIEAFVTTGRGPHAMAFDFSDATTPARALAYVGHFTDSYLGVIQLDRRKIRTFANMVLSLAPAVAPRASK
jgi:hypothetical protein